MEPCTSIYYDERGSPMITQALYNCSSRITDPLLPPSFANGSKPVDIAVQIVLNNLISIDEIEGIVELDIFFRFTWFDDRWKIPDLWPAVKPAMNNQGFDILPLIIDSNNPLQVWVPEIYFQDAVAFEPLQETFKFQNDGKFYRARHCILRVAQPSWNFEKYPMDNHNITLRFFPFSFPSDFVTISFFKEPVLYIYGSATISKPTEKNNPAIKLANFEQNPIWAHRMNDYSEYIYENHQDQIINNTMIPRVFVVGIIDIQISRQSDGVLLRLGLPVVILLILVGITFWTAYEARISETMSILLSVAALYIVIFGNIPLVGYLTSFDSYMLSMFVFVGACIVVHQMTRRMHEKTEVWPLRRVFSRLLEVSGRICVLPIVVFSYYSMFRDSLEQYKNLLVSLIVVIVVTCITQGVRDLAGVRKIFDQAMEEVKVKLQSPLDHDSSAAEWILFNLYFKGRLSPIVRLRDIVDRPAFNPTQDDCKSAAGSAGGGDIEMFKSTSLARSDIAEASINNSTWTRTGTEPKELLSTTMSPLAVPVHSPVDTSTVCKSKVEGARRMSYVDSDDDED